MRLKWKNSSEWKRWLIGTLIAALSMMVILSCSGNRGGTQTVEKKISSKTDTGRPSMGNPAAMKCINDGYELIPVMKNGVPVESICINPENGKECEVWRYFRGECRLDD